MRFIFFLIMLISITANHYTQQQIKLENLKSDFTIKKNKNYYYNKIIEDAYNTFNTEINTSTQKLWINAIQEIETIMLSNSKTEFAISKALNQVPDRFIKLQITALQAAYTLFPAKFNNELDSIFNKTNDLMSFAICANYFLNNDMSAERIHQILEEKFGNKKNDPIYIFLSYDLKNRRDNKFLNRPDIQELLNHNFQKGKTIIYSFQRNDRNFTGITIIKKPDGSFVKNSDGSIFFIKQLALSFSNLPGYISNGNTPEGIYSIIGWYISPTKTIGPTPNILLRSPFEVSPEIFYHNKNISKKWTIDDYKSLLPDSWRNYFPIYQSFYSGLIGRKLIIMHGSADELEFFRDKKYYPLTPSRGCLSSTEIWDEITGNCAESDQAKLINAFFSTKQTKGFLVVIELDDKKENVTISELMSFIK